MKSEKIGKWTFIFPNKCSCFNDKINHKMVILDNDRNVSLLIKIINSKLIILPNVEPDSIQNIKKDVYKITMSTEI
ncbi:hypothetical protein WR164_14500 [Philodulcilactobacillus myokoensis]|uniref:Uncharacterized protein n=1 Tax=Philodulcilactobacillus myokoensis TaxID=2929573 RepID=A0A9W6B289_9LACO|nr:hypothetical protein WR164_14500 [Philodulcilactobacillus myokoensis]